MKHFIGQREMERMDMSSYNIPTGKLLVVEDDRNLNRGICFALEKEGYEVVSAFSLKEADRRLENEDIRLLILDLNLPDGDGISFFQELKKKRHIPVMMLTARDMEVDEVLGLEMGAADYITKPFSLSVLRARVANVLRNSVPDLIGNDKAGEGEASVNMGEKGDWRFKDLVWKKREMTFLKNGRPLNLSITEYRLLSFFAENEGRILTKERILAVIWDNDGKYVDENTLSVNIRRLRIKLDGDEKESYIRTVFGVGYCLGG